MLRVVATPANEMEADVVSGRLAEQGIHTVVKRSVGADLPYLGAGGARYVYVDEHDFERATAALNAPEPTDDQLDELSEESYRDITGHDAPTD